MTSWSSFQPNQAWVCYPATAGVPGVTCGSSSVGGCSCAGGPSSSAWGSWGCSDTYSYARGCWGGCSSSWMPPPVPPPPAASQPADYISPIIESADYVRNLVARHIYPWSPWPEYADAATIHRLCQTPERLEAAIEVLKPALEAGGYPAMRALYLVGALPKSALPKLGGELSKLAKANEYLVPEGHFRSLAELFKDQAAEAKGKAAEEENARKWDLWQSHYGRSRVAWVPPPDDSKYAYPKMPSVQSPKNPDGWRWVLMPAPLIGTIERGGL